MNISHGVGDRWKNIVNSTRLFFKGLVSNRPKRTEVIFNPNALFLPVRLSF